MPEQVRTSFDLKSASLPVVAVVLKTTDAAQFAADLAEALHCMHCGARLPQWQHEPRR